MTVSGEPLSHATSVLRQELDRCRDASNPMDRFNSVILQGPALWQAQRRIGRALRPGNGIRRVAVTSGHMTGKSMAIGVAAETWLATYEDSGVVVMGPTLGQVRRASYAEAKSAHERSPLLRHIGKYLKTPMGLQYDDKWQSIFLSETNPEDIQGFHPRGPVLVIKDESSGQNDPEVDQALDSLKPVKRLDVSNPLKNYGLFHGLCQRSIDDPSIELIKIRSLDTPNFTNPTAKPISGLADEIWLNNMIAEYGIDSQTYKVRVLAEFPTGSDDQLIRTEWLDILGRADYQPSGPCHLAMDLGLGHGGDDATALVRDDNGVRFFWADRFTSLATLAEHAKKLASDFNIEPYNISWDAAGIGADFDYRLRNNGIIGAKPFVGGKRSKNKRFSNTRTAAHFAMRRRLDPTRNNEDGSVRSLFHLPPAFLGRFRRECRELTFINLEDGMMELRSAESVKETLGHSPDYSVTLAQSFHSG